MDIHPSVASRNVLGSYETLNRDFSRVT